MLVCCHSSLFFLSKPGWSEKKNYHFEKEKIVLILLKIFLTKKIIRNEYQKNFMTRTFIRRSWVAGNQHIFKSGFLTTTTTILLYYYYTTTTTATTTTTTITVELLPYVNFCP